MSLSQTLTQRMSCTDVLALPGDSVSTVLSMYIHVTSCNNAHVDPNTTPTMAQLRVVRTILGVGGVGVRGSTALYQSRTVAACGTTRPEAALQTHKRSLFISKSPNQLQPN